MTNNKNVLKFVDEAVALCKPAKVVWITGEESQLEELRKEALATGELIKLNEEKVRVAECTNKCTIKDIIALNFLPRPPLEKSTPLED